MGLCEEDSTMVLTEVWLGEQQAARSGAGEESQQQVLSVRQHRQLVTQALLLDRIVTGVGAHTLSQCCRGWGAGWGRVSGWCCPRSSPGRGCRSWSSSWQQQASRTAAS